MLRLERILGGLLLGQRLSVELVLCNFSFVGLLLLLFALLFVKPSLLTATLNASAHRGQDAAKDSATNEVVKVFLAGITIGDVQSGLHALKHLLTGFGQTLNAHRLAGG